METTQLAKFEPQTVRNGVVAEMEKMQMAKFVSLPENYKESAFFAIEKLANLPEIEKVPSIFITKALIGMFSEKLDFRKNHCYFFVQNDKNSSTGKSLRFGWQYQGLIHVAKETCSVKSVFPVLVFSGDVFESHYEFGRLIVDKHLPTFAGEITGGYCCVVYQNEEVEIKFYTIDELNKRRKRTKDTSGSFWAWEREMYEKTLVNATLKRIIETYGEVSNETLYNEPEENQPRHVIDASSEVVEQGEPVEAAEEVKKINI